MDKPSLVRAKIMTKSLLTPDVVRLKIKNIAPMKVNYKIGQFISLKVQPGVYRSYSIFNFDENINAFEIAAKVAHSGPGANYIKALSAGNDIEYIGPTGKFIIGTEAEKIYLFATGTGITPFLGYLRFLDTSYVKPEVKLYWGLSEKKDIFMEEIIYSYSMSIPRFEYKIYLSQEEGSFQYRKGYITKEAEDFDYDDDESLAFYLCGNPSMVEDVRGILKEKGVPDEKIHSEKYTWANSEASEGEIKED